MDGVCLRLGELMKRLALAAHPGVKKHDLFNRMVHASINEGKTGLDEKDFVRVSSALQCHTGSSVFP